MVPKNFDSLYMGTIALNDISKMPVLIVDLIFGSRIISTISLRTPVRSSPCFSVQLL